MANSTEALEREILAAMRSAMNEAAMKSYVNMKEAIHSFYAGGTPSMYTRTGAMAETPDVPMVRAQGKGFAFDAKLDQSGGYSTGSKPTMAEVLDLANYGIRFTTSNGYEARDTVGEKGFWERAEKEIEKSLNNAFSKHFD